MAKEEAKDPKFGGKEDGSKKGEPKKDNTGGEAGGNSGEKGESGGGSLSNLARMANSIQTYSRNGARYPGYGGVWFQSENRNYGQDGFVTPGFIIYDWVPTIGVASRRDDAINLAADFDYRTVRAANSGARNYAPVDLELIDLCVDSLVSAYYATCRIVTAVNTYKAENLYFGRAMVEALGYNYDDLVKNRVLLASYLDIVRKKLNQMVWIPTHSFHASHIAYNTFAYSDGDLTKSQMYIFRQKAFYCYEGADEARGVKLIECGGTYDDIIAFFERMMRALLGSEDFALIQGDIQKAWGTTAFVNVPEVVADAEIPVQEDFNVKLAIMNALVYTVDLDSCKVTQTGAEQVLVSRPKCLMSYFVDPSQDTLPGDLPTQFHFTPAKGLTVTDDEGRIGVSAYQQGAELVFNFIEAEPKPEAIAAAIRFHAVLEDQPAVRAEIASTIPATGSYDIYFESCGTEILAGAYMYELHYISNDPMPNVYKWNIPTFSLNDVRDITPSDEGGTLQALPTLAKLASFDWHHVVCPTFYLASSAQLADSAVRGVSYLPSFTDYQNPVFVDKPVVRRMHEAHMLDLFNMA